MSDLKDLTREIKDATNRIKLEEKKTSLSKSAFIDEIKSGLGEEIKMASTPKVEEPSVDIIQKESTLKRFFKSLFNTF
jgi:hypothetical protein